MLKRVTIRYSCLIPGAAAAVRPPSLSGTELPHFLPIAAAPTSFGFLNRCFVASSRGLKSMATPGEQIVPIEEVCVLPFS